MRVEAGLPSQSPQLGAPGPISWRDGVAIFKWPGSLAGTLKVCMFITIGPGEREKGGHVLRDTTSRGLYVRVWPPHTSERRGGGGGCEQEGWQGGEGRARMSGQEERQRHIRRC